MKIPVASAVLLFLPLLAVAEPDPALVKKAGAGDVVAMWGEDRAGAKAGDAAAMYRLAERYETGDGVGMDYDIAYEWFRRAAALGHAEAKLAMVEIEPALPKAMYRVARRYELGDGLPKDWREALHWYDKAAKAGHEEARKAWSNLSAVVERDPDFEKNQAASLAAFFGHTAAVKKNADDAGSMAPASDQWVFKDPADVLLKKANELAAKGQKTEAAQMIQRAADMAETASGANRYFLATVFQNGLHGLPKDPARARNLLILAADIGYVPALIDYAKLLIGERDLVKAEMMFRRAVSGAEEKAPEEKMGAAMLLVRDNLPGVTLDRARAYRLVEAAADEGLPLAQIEYGRALYLGTPPVAQDRPRAVTYWIKAADKVPQARFLLGQAYEQGFDGNPDLTEALKWYAYAGNFPGAEAKANALRDKLKVGK